jgi:DNA-directed RNA polymerase subunit beta
MSTRLAERINFSSIKNASKYPDFLDIQIKSFKDFFQLETKSDERGEEGLYNTFQDNFPITDARNQFVLEFLDYFVDPPRYSIQECIERGLTYSVPLKARLKLYCTDPEHEDFETIVQDVYLGTIPYMTPSGTFCINGAERVVVSHYTDHLAYFLVNLFMQTVQSYIQHVLFLSRDHGLNLQLTLIVLCMPILTEKRSYP